ncbi:hypothetical protein BHM03_00042364 [Ensete ventricosum]|nr:hypothetical protein BHM03_00042364 [Ensete ventricosum]
MDVRGFFVGVEGCASFSERWLVDREPGRLSHVRVDFDSYPNLLCALALLQPLFLSAPDSPGREAHPSRERRMEAVTPQPVCAMEALALLNCTVETPFDRDKCLRLLDALRSCVLEKVLLATHHVLVCFSFALGVGT